MSRSATSRMRWSVVILISLALVAAAAGAFYGMYTLARRGTFDALLQRRTPTQVVVVSVPLPSATLAPTRTPSPTAVLVATITPRPVSSTTAVVVAPTLTLLLTATSSPTATASPTQQPTTDSKAGKYVVTYLGCDPRGSDIGIVKGQIIDNKGRLVVGAEVRISLDGWPYDQPAVSNGEGWYEFYLQKGLKVKIVSLRINGEEMPLLGHEDQVFLSQGGCFEHVDLLQQ